MKIAIASDHAAVDLKAELTDWLRSQGHEVNDLGPATADRVDYPDYGYKLAAIVAAGDADRGIVLCGSGIGISIAVNRNPACRAALVSEPLSAALAREHNDANVIALGARLTGGGIYAIVRKGDRKRGILMIIAGLVMFANVGISAIPGPDVALMDGGN